MLVEYVENKRSHGLSSRNNGGQPQCESHGLPFWHTLNKNISLQYLFPPNG